MKKFTFLLLFLISSSTFSQMIKGYVLDSKTKKPIYRAHIIVGNKIVLSHRNGFFSFQLNGKKTIKFSHIKYNEKRVEVENHKLLKVFLNDKTESLDEVKVTSKKLQEYIQYTELKDFPYSVHSFGAVLKDDKILVFAGDGSFITNSLEYERQKILNTGTNAYAAYMEYANMPKFVNVKKFKNDILEYDIVNNLWSVHKNKLRKRANLNAVNIKDETYLLGGKRRTRTKHYLDEKVEVYNHRKKNVLIDDTNPHKAVNFATSVYKNKIIVTGGSKKMNSFGEKTYSNKVQFYDTETGNWFLLTKLKKGKETKSIVLANKLYLFGGFREERLKEIESYNLETDKWKNEGELFRKMERPALAKHKDVIYLFENNSLVTFNTTTKLLKEYKIKLPLNAAEMFLKDGSLYIFGGFTNKNFSVLASKKMVNVSLNELLKTKPTKTKKL